MKTYYPVRSRSIAIMLIIPLLFFSCKKDSVTENNGTYSAALQDIQSKISSTVTGFVTGETGQPVSGATVYAGNASTRTDQFGYFEIKNATQTQNAALITVVQPGYFKGIKTYIANPDEDAFLRIKLIPKITAGSFYGITGGSILVNKGLQISFIPNGVVNASTGAVYSGLVNVAAFWIDPAAPDLYRIMPGDLRGVNTGGELKGLTTFGMAAVELTGTSGELLQIAPGKKATLNISIPAAKLPYAPMTVPLWYLDELTGLWTEQGIAARSGNSYSGEVSHFSFWNFDEASSFVRFSCSLIDIAGNPLKNTLVKIALAGNPNAAGYGFTNGNGYVNGAVPAHAALTLVVEGEEQCGTPVYVQNFMTTFNDISLGTIKVNALAGLATVSGKITGCSNNPVPNGSVIMQKNNQFYRYPAGADGTYNFTTPICSGTADVELMGYDAATTQYGNPVNYSITTNKSTRADLVACGNTSSLFVNYTINGTLYSFTYPADQFSPETPDRLFTFMVSNIHREEAGFQFSLADNAGNCARPLTYFRASQLNTTLTAVSPISVNLTEKGENDQVFAGNFSGSFTGPAPGNKLFNINCSFRVKCQL